MIFVELVRRLAQRFGPYMLIEIVLPGGTLIALLLYLYRRRLTSALPAPAGSPK